MVKFKTIGISYGTPRRECIEAVRLWPGCETVSGIWIVRDNTPAGFSIRVALYGRPHVKMPIGRWSAWSARSEGNITLSNEPRGRAVAADPPPCGYPGKLLEKTGLPGI
jgi:hypothetical protein